MQEGAHGDKQTGAWPAAERWQMVHHAGARCVEWPRSAFCTAENCWAQSSPVLPNSPAWETRASRKHTLSTLLISARLSHRWRSWPTSEDIAFPRDRAVTFVAHRARSVTERSSCINLGLVLPSCILVPWLGVLAGQPRHAGQRRLGPQHCKFWP